MNRLRSAGLLWAMLLVLTGGAFGGPAKPVAADEGGIWISETREAHGQRMGWWRDARFGMFIHWGLYAVPAGEWGDNTNLGEWIRKKAEIPIDTYDEYVAQFNPVKFDADAWVKLAKRAGMKYITITSKHHDGFCLWPSAQTDYDIASTPFKRDVLRELTDACNTHGVRMTFYHSIMDWHHPDYLPRMDWERETRPAEGADYGRYVAYMKAQLKELVERYDPGLIWFDGEWEDSWTHEMGIDMYEYLRDLKPDILVNNRVDKGRRSSEGLTASRTFRGDFCTPEQHIPPTGLPGVDWESCMTMNQHWGWNKTDKKWKSTENLIRKLVDIASKGGNFLLNVGPKADGTFPEAAIERLDAIGRWMDTNSESIYGTAASPFAESPWGRCTQKTLPDGNTRLYLHVFDWPKNGRLAVPVMNRILGAKLLSAPGEELRVVPGDNVPSVEVPRQAPDKIDTVVVVDVAGEPQPFVADPYANETKEERDARMAWWREARFGMFIHWGVYAVPAGTHDGKRIPFLGEWIMHKGKIPVERYRKYAAEFNPVNYDPDAWVRLAKDAGMKYIVITSKHHDGFALFDSKVSDWNVVDATPYGKDLLKPLAEACRKHGMKLGFYYSQAQDWTHPGGAGGGWDPAQKGDMTEYIRKIAAPQVREILSNYGDIAVLWWDTPHTWMTRERADLLLPLLRLQPGIIHNKRLGGGYKGDTDTPEQKIPATGIAGRDWETCMTMNQTWGYKSYDNRWKPARQMIRNLCDIASKGGNYLLNIGPKADGTIPAASVERLKTVGKWMRVNGEAIYGTSASPCKLPEWGRITSKTQDGNTTLYLHVFHWPADNKLILPVLGKVASCAVLGRPEQAATAVAGDDSITLQLSGQAPDPDCSVIRLVFDGAIEVTESLIRAVYLLDATTATFHEESQHLRITTIDGKKSIGGWKDANAHLAWRLFVEAAGEYEVLAELATPGNEHRLKVTTQSGEEPAVIAPWTVLSSTGGYRDFKTVSLGTLTFGKRGCTTVGLHADPECWWYATNVRHLRLVPQK